MHGKPASCSPSTRACMCVLRMHPGVTWDSNIAWVSADDRSTLATFEDIFRRLRLPERFASVIPHHEAPRLYSAFYVTRSWCKSHNFHSDYFPNVGTHAMTLITPLRDYAETDSFQLTYCAHDADGMVTQADGKSPELRRYVYRKGKAIVFSSKFQHSTEPGGGRDGEAHGYLCFTFGTDDQARWADIAQTLDTQSRVVVHPDGEMRLSGLGNAIEEALRDFEAPGDE